MVEKGMQFFPKSVDKLMYILDGLRVSKISANLNLNYIRSNETHLMLHEKPRYRFSCGKQWCC